MRGDRIRMTSILLDLDGVLVDSWKLVEQSLLAAAEELNLDCRGRLGDFRARMGMPLELILDELGLPAEFAFNFRKAARLRDGRIRPFEGISAMLGHMRDAGLRIGVVTGKDRPRTISILETSGLAPLVDAVVTASDAPGKPQPDGLWLCERLLGNEPALAFVGDTVIDMQAAENAGRTPVLAIWGGEPPSTRRPGWIEVLDPRGIMTVIDALKRQPMRRAGS
jgi:phosphoglycolate phosphatase-like HAD superfamily hydrolase